MTCLEIFRRRNLALVFRENPSSLNELMGYVESTVFHEIWPEHALIDKEQKFVGEFFILNTFLVAASNATRYANFLIVQLDRSIKC